MDRFKGVVFRESFPQQAVPEHVCCMQFNDDEHAIWFREWWNLVGAEEFARYLKNLPKETP